MAEQTPRQKIEEWLKTPAASMGDVLAGRIVRVALAIIDAEHPGFSGLSGNFCCRHEDCAEAQEHEAKLWEAIRG